MRQNECRQTRLPKLKSLPRMRLFRRLQGHCHNNTGPTLWSYMNADVCGLSRVHGDHFMCCQLWHPSTCFPLLAPTGQQPAGTSLPKETCGAQVAHPSCRPFLWHTCTVTWAMDPFPGPNPPPHPPLGLTSHSDPSVSLLFLGRQKCPPPFRASLPLWQR